MQGEQVARNEGDKSEDKVNETEGSENESTVDGGKGEMIGDESAGTGDKEIIGSEILNDKQ